MAKLFGIILLWILSSANAFTLSRTVQHRASTTLFVSQPLPEDAPHTFGRPLDEGTKEFNKKLVYGIKTTIFDTFFAEQTIERSFARFWALETVARMPYFSYLSALFLYETLGWWRRSDYLKIHFFQTWNEQHHLLIMEELEGDRLWVDRFLAQHMALGYYFVALAFYLVNPTFAYNFNQVVEEEAFDTYDRFLASNEEFLKGQPAPRVAKQYYLEDDLFLEMGSRPRPTMESLYDTFCEIRADEAEHAETMVAMQEEGL
jgi:ubiquinol oxidase